MRKVAIIGSGPCGLSILRAFQQAEEKGQKSRGDCRGAHAQDRREKKKRRGKLAWDCRTSDAGFVTQRGEESARRAKPEQRHDQRRHCAASCLCDPPRCLAQAFGFPLQLTTIFLSPPPPPPVFHSTCHKDEQSSVPISTGPDDREQSLAPGLEAMLPVARIDASTRSKT